MVISTTIEILIKRFLYGNDVKQDILAYKNLTNVS